MERDQTVGSRNLAFSSSNNSRGNPLLTCDPNPALKPMLSGPSLVPAPASSSIVADQLQFSQTLRFPQNRAGQMLLATSSTRMLNPRLLS
jgi:hypothetical protein